MLDPGTISPKHTVAEGLLQMKPYEPHSAELSVHVREQQSQPSNLNNHFFMESDVVRQAGEARKRGSSLV